MNRDHKDLQHLQDEEDATIACALADALTEDNVEKFLQLYDEIPASVSPHRLGNIKEMARQVAALTRTSNYRHGSGPGKDLPYFGINHSLQTSQLSINGSLGSTDFSAFKTPPEGSTPVDPKQFDYGEDTLRTVLYEGSGHLDDAIITQKDGLSAGLDLNKIFEPEKLSRCNDKDNCKTDDDAFHTPPEFQDDNNSVPPDELITSVISRVSETSLGSSEWENKGDLNQKDDLPVGDMVSQEECEKYDISIDEELTSPCTEKVNSQVESLDGLPSTRSSFVQQDDSGISTVEKNDINCGSTTTFSDKNSSDRKVERKSNLRMHSENYTHRPGTISDKRNRPLQSEFKYPYSNFHEGEDSIGWQTRYKRMGRKRNEKDLERRLNYYDSDGYERSNNPDFFRKGFREVRNKDKNFGMEKVKNLSKTGEKVTEGCEKGKENSAYTSKKNEDIEIDELTSIHGSKCSGRRGGPASHFVKKSDARWHKNSTRDKYSETERKEESTLANSSFTTIQPSVFSYRDALLKVGAKASNSKDTSQQQVFTSKADRTDFDLHSATSYLSSVWTNVINLHRTDPSKVFIYSDD